MPALSRVGFKRSLALGALDLTLILGGLVIFRELHHYTIDQRNFVLLVMGLVPLVLVVFHIARVYEALHLSDLGQWCVRVLVGWCAALGFVFGGLYALKVASEFPRLVMGPWALTTALLLVLSRLGLYLVMLSRHRRGVSQHTVILAGEHAYCRRLARHFQAHPSIGFRVLGIVTDQVRGNGAGDRFPVLGGLDDLPRLVDAQHVQRVIITAPITDQATIGRVFNRLVRHPVTIQYAPDLSRFTLIGFHAADYGGQPVFNLTGSPLNGVGLVVKWLEDKLLAGVLLLLTSPVLLLCALLVKLTSPGPVLFVQHRHGIYGRPIRVYKFRTMRAEDSAEAIDGCERSDSGRFRQARAADGRVTAIGRFLRRTSLDELPQLLNVLKGDMSLVGPRPHPIQLNEDYIASIDELMRRHYMKPGITGLAQINGCRGETRTLDDMRRRVNYDLEYVRNWSLWVDIKILLLTPFKGFLNDQP